MCLRALLARIWISLFVAILGEKGRAFGCGSNLRRQRIDRKDQIRQEPLTSSRFNEAKINLLASMLRCRVEIGDPSSTSCIGSPIMSMLVAESECLALIDVANSNTTAKKGEVSTVWIGTYLHLRLMRCDIEQMPSQKGRSEHHTREGARGPIIIRGGEGAT